MKKFIYSLFLVLCLTAVSNIAQAGKEKTTDALVEAMTQIEKSNIKATPALTKAMKSGEVLLKGYYNISRDVVYETASNIFDELVKHNNGSSIDITKPDWLN